MHLNVMYAADNNYAPFLGVSLFSLLENNKDIEEITVYAVLDNVSEENKTKLSDMMKSYSREWIPIDAKEFNKLMEELGVPKYRGSYATHFRKFFHLIVKDNVEKLLYIDSDSIVPGNLRKLLEIDLGEACAGVVLDALGNKYKLLLGFLPEETYFNAGVTLIDVANWKKNRCTELLMNHITNVRAKYCNPDQDLFNMVLRGKTKVLPCEYNFMPVHRAYSDKAFERCYGFSNYYTKEDVAYARNHPVIIHAYRFLGEFPWHQENCHPDTELFDYYLKQSPWSDYKKKKSNARAIFSIEKMLYKCLPSGVFLKIYSVCLYDSFRRRDRKLRG